MAKLLKLRRGSTTQHSSFTGAEGEVTIDTTKDTAVVHDGSQAGGRPLLREDMSNLPAGTIDNADINASAAIAGTKISPNFGSQNIATTGAFNANAVTITSSSPSITFTDSNENPDFYLRADGGEFKIIDSTNSASRLIVRNDGTIDVQGNLDANAGLDVTGDITATGDLTVSGGDITLNGTTCLLNFNDTNNNPDFRIQVESGNFLIEDTTNNHADRFVINSDGHIDIPGNLDVGAGLNVTGEIVGDKLTLEDDNTSSPILNIKTDDNGPWGIRLGNDTYSSNNDHGMMSYLSNSGEGHFSIRGNGVYENMHFNQSNGTTNKLVLRFDASDQSAELYAGGNKKLETDSTGIAVTGNIAVTGSVDGRDINADGNKLDNIESGATADQTAAEIRTLVESASDSNVFTDADHSKLNGIESGATADQTGAEIASALNGQHIRTTAQIGRDSNDHFQFTDNNRLDLYINGNNEFRFESDGDFHADGDVYAYSTTTASDENLKENIVTITDSVAKVEALKGVTFKWKKNDLVSAGVIAQDVEKVLPEVVKTVGDVDGNEYKAVNYGGLTSILIEAIKDLSARIKVLEAK